MNGNGENRNWDYVQMFLPRGWQAQARILGALRRDRKISSPEQLLRALLIHLSEGCSLRETSMRAAEGKICEISDVALLKRLKGSSEWFRWMSLKLLSRRHLNLTKPSWLDGYHIRSFDATVVCEPGSTGTDWRLHYCIELFSLHCEDFKLTRQDVGESFVNFDFKPGDLAIGDRAYSRLKGLWYVKEMGADFLSRYYSRSFSFCNSMGGFDIHNKLKKLEFGEIADWMVEVKTAYQKSMPLRLCALKLSEKAAEQAVKRAMRDAKKKQKAINKNTIELHKYVILCTSLREEEVSSRDVMELYRARWQIEIAFKRLKSIIGIGHLPKNNIESAKAWLHGKILVALLVQSIVDEGRFFSPWGYPLGGN